MTNLLDINGRASNSKGSGHGSKCERRPAFSVMFLMLLLYHGLPRVSRAIFAALT